MSIKEILDELPKLTQEEKRKLWNVFSHEVSLIDKLPWCSTKVRRRIKQIVNLTYMKSSPE